MASLIKHPTVVQAAGNKLKRIEEFVGLVNSNTRGVSIARMKSPEGWTEPGQKPDFDEYTVVLKGTVRAKLIDRELAAAAGEALFVGKGEWVQYRTPDPEGAEYISVCLPAFSPETVHRDET
ncbi:MAG TPA: cupin [Terriglobia bacterium]